MTKFRIEVKRTEIGNVWVTAESRDAAIAEFQRHVEHYANAAEWYDGDISMNEVEAEEVG